jgi:hypothetical protein
MPHEIAVPTTCNHCGRKFYGPRGPIVIGERPAARFQSFIGQLGRHIMEAHPEVAQAMVALNWEFQGYALMKNFTTQDPAVQRNEDFFRWKLHQSTLRARARRLDDRAQMVADDVCSGIIPSEDAEQIKQVAALRKLIQQKTAEALEELRQILEEPDLYKVQAGQMTENTTQEPVVDSVAREN